jgi:hypothetical protein
VNHTLSLAGYDPNLDELFNKQNDIVSTP